MFRKQLSIGLTVVGLTAGSAHATVRYVDADAPAGADNSQNSYHVVAANGTDETTILDGVTITPGNAGWLGGCEHPITDDSGTYDVGSTPPTLTNCPFRRQDADGRADDSHTVVVNRAEEAVRVGPRRW